MFNFSVVFGILAFIGYGFGDYFASKATKKEKTIKVSFWVSIIGLIVLSALFLSSFKSIEITKLELFLMVLSGVSGTIAFYAYYRGLEVEKVSLLSPLVGGCSAVTVILSIFFLAERPVGIQYIGIILVILGTVLISIDLKDPHRLKSSSIKTGIKYGLVAMFSWGLMFFLLSATTITVGWITPLLITVIIQTIFFTVLLLLNKKEGILPSKNSARSVAMNGIFYVAAFVAYGIGVAYGNTTIVTPLGSAAPVLTVILAIAFLKEKLDAEKIFAIILAIIGIILLSV